MIKAKNIAEDILKEIKENSEDSKHLAIQVLLWQAVSLTDECPVDKYNLLEELRDTLEVFTGKEIPQDKIIANCCDCGKVGIDWTMICVDEDYYLCDGCFEKREAEYMYGGCFEKRGIE